MLIDILGFNDHVIHINFHISPYLFFEDFVHEPLICGASIFQSEWHDLVTVVYIFGDKCGFFFVRGMHADLLVAGVSVKEAEKLESDAPSTNLSMLGRGYASLGYALLR